MVIDLDKVFDQIQILSVDPAQKCEGAWQVSPDAPYFDGHFAGLPVFPGVALVDGSWMFLLRALQLGPMSYSKIPSARFFQTVQPGQKVRLIGLSQGARDWLVEWREEGTGEILAAIRFQY